MEAKVLKRQCPTCKRWFSTVQALRGHERFVHGENAIGEIRKKDMPELMKKIDEIHADVKAIKQKVVENRSD
jgi:hypothetical protein